MLGDFTVTHNSTIITKIAKEFFEANDVGTLSNNSEKQFGLSGIYQRLMFIAPEIKSDFSMDQAVFQSMVSGEDVSVSIKNKTPTSVIWNVPGIMSGNQTPNWTDNYGSMSRRIVLFLFLLKVKNIHKDPLLDRKLKNELPALMKKCNSAYLYAVNNYGKKDIWVQLPNYFKETQQSLSEETNALQHFLSSSKIIYGSDLYCRENVFKLCLQQHCRDTGFSFQKYTADTYLGPFQDAGENEDVVVKVVRSKKLRYPRDNGRMVHGTFITGLDISSEYCDDKGNNERDTNRRLRLQEDD